MTLPDFIAQPLEPLPGIVPFPGQFEIPFPSDLETDPMPATKTKPNTKKSTKPAKGQKMKPSDAVSSPGSNAAVPDTTSMLRAALLFRDGARKRWTELNDNVLDDGQPGSVPILDQLAEEWEDNPGQNGDHLTAWRANGIPLPSIWLGSFVAQGEPNLKGMALVDAVRPLIREIAQERPPQPPLIVPAIEQPPNGRLPLDRIRVVTNPREDFDPVEMQNLEDSIRARGIIQALTVAPADAEGMHTLIAGERRLRCARKLDLPDVPVYVRQFEAEDEAVDRLVENLQRVNLKPMELANGFNELLAGGVSQRELARRLGVSQGHVGNTVRLLKLPPLIQTAVNSGEIGKAEGRTLASWTDHPAVINEFTDIWKDKLEGGQYADTPFLKVLQLAVKDATRAVDKAHDGPRFKLTPEIRSELQIIHVKVGDWEADRAFYTPLWDELQAKADKERADKRAAAESKRNASQTPATSDPATPVQPQKPTLAAHTVSNMWKGWFIRALLQRFSVKRLKPADVDHLNRLALLLLEPLPHLLDHFKLNDSGDEASKNALMQQSLEGMLDGLRSELLLELANGYLGLFSSAAEAHAMCEAVGISLKTWSPDVPFLTVVPGEVLFDWASEYDMKPSKDHNKLVDQMVACWTLGWIPEPLNIFPAAE